MNPLALVTGAGTGIGRALALRLIARGCDVLALGRRAAPLESLAAEHPGRVTTLALDVSGRVLHISSGAAHRALAGWGPYCMSKAALHMLTQCWNAELGPRNVLVGSARPGVVDTPMQETIRGLTSEDFPDVEAFRRMKREGALLPPEDVARFLAWMLLDANAEQFAGAERDIRDADIEPLWRA